MFKQSGQTFIHLTSVHLPFVTLQWRRVWAIGSYPITSRRSACAPEALTGLSPAGFTQTIQNYLNISCSIFIKFRLGLLPTATRVIVAFQRHHVETHCFGGPCRRSGYQPDLYRVLLTFRVSVYCCVHETVTLTFNDHGALQTASWSNFASPFCWLPLAVYTTEPVYEQGILCFSAADSSTSMRAG